MTVASSKAAKLMAPELMTPLLKAPDYWDQACAELMKHDRIMRKLIPKYPKAEFLTTRGDPFQTLAIRLSVLPSGSTARDCSLARPFSTAQV